MSEPRRRYQRRHLHRVQVEACQVQELELELAEGRLAGQPVGSLLLDPQGPELGPIVKGVKWLSSSRATRRTRGASLMFTSQPLPFASTLS